MKSKYLSSIVGSLVLCFSMTVNAHAHVQKSVPEKNSTIKASPEAVSIYFSEDLEASMSKVVVKNLTTGEVVSEKTEAGTEKSTLLTHLKYTKNEKAKFEVTWKAVSKDSHTMKGSYNFTVDPSSK